ncbi:hypothetical protein E3E31_01090 [Thermococcus sp. M39]|uniref:DUF257 family protein n=1 Tax=unclassified Thermococcus TaxID=2627626 RepID=UPI00143C32EB|nr:MULTISPECIES: DUF257 family protein [unclassified Thermococcus]NJE07150.1 hypothetical protein [Thermococcus sp. M39]NJE12718.1 hypothetical protein [Thermococcus sp. LS2]
MYNTLDEFLEKIKPGETILIEYCSLDHPELVFYSIIKWAKDKGFPILIHDILDTLHVFAEHLRLSGHDIGFIKDIAVIKSGGIMPIGKIIKKARITDDIPVYSRDIHEAVKEFLTKIEERPIITVVLGAEKILKRHENQPRVIEYFFEVVARKFLGNTSRITYIFGNPYILRQDVKVEFEENPTRILEVLEYGKKVKIKKSPYLQELMHEMEVRL